MRPPLPRLVVLLAVLVVVAAACTSASDDAANDGTTAVAVEPQLLTLNHLTPRPDFVGRRPEKFAWTPIAGADSYAIGLVSEIDTVVWQARGIPGAEVAWPKGLEVAEGTYFWMVEGYQGSRRIAESGRAAFVVEP